VVRIRTASILASILTILIVGVSLSCSTNEEKRVRNQFKLLSEFVSKDRSENALTMAQKIKNTAQLFVDGCEINVPDQSVVGSYSRDEIARYAGQARLQFSKLSLRFHDLDIYFPENAVALVTVTARAEGNSKDGERVNEVRELQCALTRTEDVWLFSRIEVVEVLQK
jgi:hypothetical protein